MPNPGDDSESESNLVPLFIFGGYVLLAASLTIYILRTSLQPYLRLTNTSVVRKNVHIFFGLAALSLFLTWYYMIYLFVVSYRSWAMTDGVKYPNLDLGGWLKDTSLMRDAWEIVIEKAGRFWWSQQIFLGTAIWSVYLGIQGRQRNIPNLWVFMLLGQIVAISFAQNLFFLAVLLTPKAEKPAGRTATATSWLIPLVALFSTYISVFILPSTSNTPYFLPTLAISHIALFLPLYFPPPKLGPYLVGGMSVFLHINQTVRCINEEDPLKHYHRNHNALPADANAWAFFHHPAVSSVGWDVILCGLSLLVWSAVDGQAVSERHHTRRKQPDIGNFEFSLGRLIQDTFFLGAGGLGVLASFVFDV